MWSCSLQVVARNRFAVFRSTRRFQFACILSLLAIIISTPHAAMAAISITGYSPPFLPTFPPAIDRNAPALANALTSGGAGGIQITSSLWSSGVSNSQGMTHGIYTVTTGNNYGLTSNGIVLSTGDVRDYASGPNLGGTATRYGRSASAGMNAQMKAITGHSSHYDVAALDLVFDAGPTTKEIGFDMVFGSEEWPDYVNSQFVDGLGLFLNGQNIAFSGGKPVNIRHPAMAAIPSTGLNAVLAPMGIPVVRYSAPVVPGSKGNRLRFIIADTSDDYLDSTVFISGLGALNAEISFNTLRNFDVVSPLDMAVNDFQVTLQGVNRPLASGDVESPDYVGGQLSSIYPPPHKYGQLPPGWTPESVTTNGSDTVVKWGPGQFITGQKLHFGISLTAEGESVCTGICMAWTQDGVPVYSGANPNLPITVHTPHPRPGEAAVQIVNQTCPEQTGPPANRWIGAIYAAVFPEHLDLAELVVDNALMQSATIINEAPTYLAAGEILSLTNLDAANPIEVNKSMVVWYHVFEDQNGTQGSFIGTSFTAFNYTQAPERIPVPEPNSALLLAFAGAWLGAWRRQVRKD